MRIMRALARARYGCVRVGVRIGALCGYAQGCREGVRAGVRETPEMGGFEGPK